MCVFSAGMMIIHGRTAASLKSNSCVLGQHLVENRVGHCRILSDQSETSVSAHAVTELERGNGTSTTHGLQRILQFSLFGRWVKQDLWLERAQSLHLDKASRAGEQGAANDQIPFVPLAHSIPMVAIMGSIFT